MAERLFMVLDSAHRHAHADANGDAGSRGYAYARAHGQAGSNRFGDRRHGDDPVALGEGMMPIRPENKALYDPEMTPISYQVKYQRKQLAAGNCRTCGKKRTNSRRYCEVCRIKQNMYKRKAYHNKKGIKEMPKVSYPKINGKKLDSIQRINFDRWKERFETCINMTEDSIHKEISSEERASILAYNLAFEVISTESQ